MSGIVALSAIVLFFGATTLLMVVLVMRAPIIEDFDDVASHRQASGPEKLGSLNDRARKPGQSRQIASQNSTVFSPHARQATPSRGHVNLPR